MTSEILFQENTEIDSIQQMITTIHNHIAEYRSNLSRRPNVYRPKIAELKRRMSTYRLPNRHWVIATSSR